MNFLPESDSLFSLLKTSFEALQVECEEAYQRMGRLMQGKSLLLEIGEEAVLLVFQAGNVEVLDSTGHKQPPLRLTSGAQAILDMVDGKASLLEVVLSGDLELKGDVHEIGDVYEALITYLRGAVRCPSFPVLLDHFREVQSRRLVTVKSP